MIFTGNEKHPGLFIEKHAHRGHSVLIDRVPAVCLAEDTYYIKADPMAVQGLSGLFEFVMSRLD